MMNKKSLLLLMMWLCSFALQAQLSPKREFRGAWTVSYTHLLDQENNAVNGPRFDDPSTVAGTEGNKVSAKWEPVAISVLVDAGDGQLAAAESDMTQATGAYKEWMTGDFASYNTLYMKSTASRYAGPTGPDGKPMVKKIDIGVFEYQYPEKLSDRDIVYLSLIHI